MSQNPKSMMVKRSVPLSNSLMGLDGVEHDELVFVRKIRVGDLRLFDESKGENETMIKLVAALTNMRVTEIEKIELDNWPAVMEVVNDFLRPFAQAAKVKASSEQ